MKRTWKVGDLFLDEQEERRGKIIEIHDNWASGSGIPGKCYVVQHEGFDRWSGSYTQNAIDDCKFRGVEESRDVRRRDETG